MGYTGISVEDPCLFTYGGRWYYFTVMISNPDTTIGAQNLDNKHLELFEYTNEINSLCLYGNIIYHDLDGSVSRFFNRMDNHVQVVCQQMEKVTDGDKMEMFVPIKKSDGADCFAHTFIVQNISILNRDKQAITYQISLLSVVWYLLCSEITFSNYPLDEDDEANKPKNGYNMLKHFLTDAITKNSNTSFKVDDKSFDACAEKSKIKIPFITNGNDNIFSVVKYIFDRMYWSKDKMDESLKYIVFNPITNTYKCINYSDDTSWFACEKPIIYLSMFETTYEQELFSVNNQLASMANINQTDTYEDLFDHHIWQYDPTLNIFTNNQGFSQKELALKYNAIPDNFKEICGVNTEPKYPEQLRSEWFRNTGSYHHQSPGWNITFSLYQKLIDNLKKRDALVVNTEGDITHQPGACLGIVLDRTIEKLPEITPQEKEELYKKHRQIEGLFPILKVQHRYHMNTSPDNPASYTENVVLGRNFTLPPPK